MNMQRGFLLLETLAAVAATPASGQALAPTVGPADSGTQSAAFIPDFSGILATHRYPDSSRRP
jgi:hypothetical protein